MPALQILRRRLVKRIGASRPHRFVCLLTQDTGPFTAITPDARIVLPNGHEPFAGPATLIATRNGIEVTRKKLGNGSGIPLALKRVQSKDDVLAWRIEDTAGKIAYRGALGFPMSGAVPNLVRYEVNLDRFPALRGK
jgi:hypothetical protein